MAEVYELENKPTAAEYVRALAALGERVTDKDRILFRVHYQVPDRIATASQIAEWAGVATHGAVNLRYGNLGRAVCDVLGIKPEPRPNDTYRWWSVWSRGWDTPGGFVWQMHSEVAEALELLGWVDPPKKFTSPDEVVGDAPLVEGAVCQIMVNAYERNAEARRRCLEAHGTACCVCGFQFGAVYGGDFEGFIHVHHVRPLSEIGSAYEVNPVEDLRPVCPNCHSVLHFRRPAYSIEDVKRFLERRQ